jgi:hypothetical protein
MKAFTLGCLLAVVAVAAKAGPNLARMVLCYYPLDGNAAPKFVHDRGTRARAAGGFTFESGRVGQAAWIRAGRSLDIPTDRNLSNVQGSISFWARLDVADEPRALFACTCQGIYETTRLVLNSAIGTVCFTSRYRSVEMTEPMSDDPSATLADWQPDAWHHFAVTWYEVAPRVLGKSVYVDGELVGTARITGLHHEVFEPGLLQLGGSLKIAGAPGLYDELILWRSALQADEVRALYEGAWNNRLASPEFVTREDAFGTLHAQPNAADGVYAPGATVRLTFSQKLARGAKPARKASIYVMDYFGDDVSGPLWTKTVRGRGALGGTVSWQTRKCGAYKWRLRLADERGELVREKDLLCFAVIPREMIERKTSPDDLLGTHIDYADYSPSAARARLYTPLARKMGNSWVRNHDFMQLTYWRWVEKQKGQFTWYDDCVQHLRENGFHILGLLMHPPEWACKSFSPPSTYPAHPWYPWHAPNDLDAYRNYVARTVAHYRGRIEAYEIWNEAFPSGFIGGDRRLFLEVAKIAYGEAKAADPTVKVVGNGAMFFTPDTLEVMKWLFDNGQADYMDIAGLHTESYESGDYPAWAQGNNPLDVFKGYLADAGHADMPLWMTESYSHGSTSMMDPFESPYTDQGKADWRDDAGLAVGEMAALRSVGFSKVFLGAYRAADILSCEPFKIADNVAPGGGPRCTAPKAGIVAMAMYVYLIGNAECRAKADLAHGAKAFVFDREGQPPIALVFHYTRPVRDPLLGRVPSGATVLDIMAGQRGVNTIPISREPVYLLAPSGMDLQRFVDLIRAMNIEGPERAAEETLSEREARTKHQW